MDKDPSNASTNQEANDSAEVSNRKALLIAMLNDIKPDTDKFAFRQNNLTESISDEDYDMLTLVLSDAFHGEDIPTQYPKFYKKLLTDPLLRQTFLDMLNTLETDEQNNAVDLPIYAVDLSFLDYPPRS